MSIGEMMLARDFRNGLVRFSDLDEGTRRKLPSNVSSVTPERVKQVLEEAEQLKLALYTPWRKLFLKNEVLAELTRICRRIYDQDVTQEIETLSVLQYLISLAERPEFDLEENIRVRIAREYAVKLSKSD